MSYVYCAKILLYSSDKKHVFVMCHVRDRNVNNGICYCAHMFYLLRVLHILIGDSFACH